MTRRTKVEIGGQLLATQLISMNLTIRDFWSAAKLEALAAVSTAQVGTTAAPPPPVVHHHYRHHQQRQQEQRSVTRAWTARPHLI